MKFHIKLLKIFAGKPVVFIHEATAKKINVHIADRVTLLKDHHKTTAIVDIAFGFIRKNEVAISEELASILGTDAKGLIEIEPAEAPEGSRILHDKLECTEYKAKELEKIIQDIVNNNLSDAEVAYFISGVNHCGMSFKETLALTNAIVKTGKKIKWSEKMIVDKHSIGGIPGNRTTPIVVSICAAAGLTIPKTSSRAITSASGTADTIEAMAPVDLTISQLKSVVKKTGACLAWGGSLGLAPADDKLIRVEKLLRLDPEPQLLASILAKKVAVGSTHVLIDIPFGEGAKVSLPQAQHLKKMFESLGNKIGLKIQTILTDGTQPIGNGIGPVLEMRDVIRVLKQDNPPKDLESKSLVLAGKILEMCGKAKKGQGQLRARDILYSCSAYEKFCQIIEAQGGDPKTWMPEAKFHHTFISSHSGTIKKIDNPSINYLARIVGCPNDKSAGIYLHKHVNEKVKIGDKIMTLYSESKEKLSQAIKLFKKQKSINIF